MKNNLPIAFFATIIYCVLVFNSMLFAQGDDPYTDALPQEWIQNINYSDSEFDVITTADGFDNFNLGVNFAEPHVSQNPMNPLQYFGAYNTNGAWRTDDGHDWIGFSPSFGVSANGDPVTAYDSLGHLYYETMYGSIVGCKVIMSTDNGQTWTTAVTSIAGNDKNWIAADQTSGPYANYIYTTMSRSGGYNFARSTDFGQTWTQTGSFTHDNRLPGCMVAVGPNTVGGDVPGGAVYVVTNHGNAFAETFTFYLSTDGGATFTLKSNQNFANYVGTNVNGRNSVQNMRTRPYPFITVDNSYGLYRGRLYLVYASNQPAGNGNKPDIFCRYSDDQGVTWSTAVTVNDDINSTNNHQWHPSTWCDKQTGKLFIKWMDTRDTPTSDSAYIYASYSDDGGQTFKTNQRISNAKMRINCSSCGGGGTPRYQGDYDAIVSLDGQSLAMWTDFRSGNFGSYVGYFPDFAMLVSPANPTIDNTNGTAVVSIEVPDVKLYEDVVSFSAAFTSTPSSGTLNLNFPSGNTLATFPGTVDLEITTSGTVTNGNYDLVITGEGPNGTPVHRRTVVVTVQDPVPVELTLFTVIQLDKKLQLVWATATETNNLGFEIERKEADEFQRIGFVEGYGTTTEVHDYAFTDEDIVAGKYSYRLKQIDFDGTFEYSSIVEVDITKPVNYNLSQNYPNPFNPNTTIAYTIPQDGLVSLKVYDILGNEVSVLVNEYQTAGSREIQFNAGNLSSGVYYYEFVSGEFSSIKKLILMK